MKKQVVVVISCILIILAVLGFLPQAGLRLPLATVFGASLLLSALYAIAGIVGLLAAFKNPKLTIIYGQVFGVIFALLTIFGFLSMLDIWLAPTTAGNIFHLVLATILLYVGFAEDQPVDPVVE